MNKKIAFSLSVLATAAMAVTLSYCSNTGIPAACSSTPAVGSVLSANITSTSSTAASAYVSHRPGEDCLSCHKTGGSSQTAFAYAGTVYTAVTSTTIAAAGTQVTTGNNTPNVVYTDSCGNFYSTTAGTFTTAAGAKVGTAGTAMSRSNAADASCNSSGCHDTTRRIY